jgi:hypothetical protein
MVSIKKNVARTTERGQIHIRNEYQGQHKHMYALRIRLYDRQPSECMRSGFSASADAQEKARTCQIVSVLGAGVRVGHKGYHAEVRRKRRWWTITEGSRLIIGGSCISQEDIKARHCVAELE